MTMPKSCDVADLLAWIHCEIPRDVTPADYHDFAHDLRLLLKDVATRAVRAAIDGGYVAARDIPAMVARVLGAP